LNVLRKTDIGYMLSDGNEEVFLHFNESMHQDLSVNQVVDAFLYFDQKGRVAATLQTPKITLKEPARLNVVTINDDLGVFLDMGIHKDLLLSIDELPLDRHLWPHIGDRILVKMIQKNRLTAKPINKEDLNIDKDIELKEKVEATIQKIGHAGLNALTDDDVWVFIHNTMYEEDIWLGKRVLVLITHKSEKGYSGSLLKQKENKMVDDADIILQYLIKNKEMTLDATSTPEDIFETFQMSKKAFKRAIGILYKQRRIDFVEGKTKLLEL
ncbi:MAG: S1-like domain-containing RNA-binding protein, partial [Acholeplasmataceae bacterium]